MIFIDTNIIIDLGQEGSQWREWSLERLAQAISRGPVVMNAIVCRAVVGLQIYRGA